MNLHPFIVPAKESTRALTCMHNWKKVKLLLIKSKGSFYKDHKNVSLFIWWIKKIFMEQDIEFNLSLQDTVIPQV